MRTLYRMKILFLLLALLLVSASCAQVEKTLGMEGGAGNEVPEQATASYLDFEDVKIPYNLTINRDDSFVYMSGGLKAGVLRLYGDAPANEIMSFFEKNMPHDGWTLLTSFKYQKNILIFTKAGRVCLITSEPPHGWADLVVEVWVSPTEGRDGPYSLPLPGGQTGGDSSYQPQEETLSN